MNTSRSFYLNRSAWPPSIGVYRHKLNLWEFWQRTENDINNTEILELKNNVTEIRILMDGFDSKTGIAEERVSE